VWNSFGITKNLTAGNFKILLKNRRQKNQKLPKIDAGTSKSVSENPKFVIFNFSHIFFKNLLGGDLDVRDFSGFTPGAIAAVNACSYFEDQNAWKCAVVKKMNQLYPASSSTISDVTIKKSNQQSAASWRN